MNVTDDSVTAQILLVEDSSALRAVYKEYLVHDGHSVSAVETGEAAMQTLQRQVPDVLLLDLHLPDISGMEILRHVHQQGLSCAVIIITAHGSVDVAAEAMRFGAADFLTKPFTPARLRVTLNNVLEKRELQDIVSRYQETFERDHFHRFIGQSLPMQAVYRMIESAAPSRATVFINGLSGTGKELCAEAIHAESPRKDQPFVAINCAAIPRELIESEIFGHVKGAFTGAVSAREGAASRADGGTLFLDELCEMDLDLQSKLLRFIQTGRFQRVGDNKEQAADIRFICATNRDPLQEVKAGRFREDLYYRLNVIPIQLPPLRERDRDILLIATNMLRRLAQEEGKGFTRLAPAVQKIFQRYAWPGNVRELENVIRNIVVLNDGQCVTQNMLPVQLCGQSDKNAIEDAPQQEPDVTAVRDDLGVPDAVPSEEFIRPLWMEERDIIERAITACAGNIPKAAVLLEISASTIYRKRSGWQTADSKKAGRS